MASQQIYEQQIESGKEIVREMFRNLAVEFQRPRINDFFTYEEDLKILFIDAHRRKTVVKVKESDLADVPTSPLMRRWIETQVREAVRGYYD